MAFTYGNPAEKVLWAVRFELQDVNSEAPLLQDEEVEYSISKEISGEPPSQAEVLSAAAHCMEVLSRRFDSVADTVTGSLRILASRRAERYAKAAKEIRKKAIGMHSLWVGGTSESEKEAYENNQDAVLPFFKRNQFNIPEVPSVPPGLQEREGER